MAKLAVNDRNVNGKRVFVRVDDNVPMEEMNGQMVINDEARIRTEPSREGQTLKKPGTFTSLGAILLGLVAVAGASAKDLAPYDSDHFFDAARLVRIDLEIAPKDWDVLRVQHRSLIKSLRTDVPSSEREKTFDYFRAELTIDGTRVGPVSVRKKGFVGSLSQDRPSLKLRLNEYDKGKRFAGVETLTLNNNQQDPTRVNQVVGYALFRKAGLLASRCNLAAVTVNGAPLGIYSNVESLDARFFDGRFPKGKGALWEGTVCDFDEDAIARFERKFGPQSASEKLAAAVAALQRPDAEVLDAFAKTVDLEKFLRFWALEVLLGHWDGYASNRNNYFVFYNAHADRLLFLPWGADQLGQDANPLWGDPTFVPPKSVKAASVATRRLYELPEARKQYFAAMRSLLKEVWNEEQLLKQIKDLNELIKGKDSASTNRSYERRGDFAAFVRNRRSEIEAELDKTNPQWTLKPFEPIGRISLSGEIDIEFSVTRKESGSASAKSEATSGSARIRMTLRGKPVLFDAPTFKLATEKMPWGGTKCTLNMSRPATAPDEPATIELTFYTGIPGESLTAKPLRVDVFASPAQGRVLEPTTDGAVPKGLAAIGGELNLTRFDPGNSAEIKGHLSGELYTNPKADAPK